MTPAEASAHLLPRLIEGPRAVGADRERQVLELFRHIGAFRASYDVALLDRAASFAATIVGVQGADDLMAAAIRLDNEMRCQTNLDYVCLPAGSPERHDSEDAFLGMLRSACGSSERAALGLAARLGITETRALFAAARDLALLVGWPPRTAPRDTSSRAMVRTWSGTGVAYGQA